MVIEGRTREKGTLPDRMRFYKTPGVSVAVIHNGSIAWARGYGVREADTAGAVTPETIFQAASISKAVAALVALRLVEDGKLDLDEDVNRKLVSWKVPENQYTKNSKVTLRGLLSHSSGMVEPAEGTSGIFPDQPFPALPEILEGKTRVLREPARIGFVPGTRWQYCNAGYCVLQLLIEDVLGKPFAQVADEVVLKPLGLVNSSFARLSKVHHQNGCAAAHNNAGKPLPEKWLDAPPCTGGLWTTPSDLARFAIEIERSAAGASNSLLSPQLARKMLTRQAGNWGLGVGLTGSGEAERFFHSGSFVGFE